MARASTLKLEFRDDGVVVVPTSGTSQWKTVVPAGGPAVQDNSGTVTNPDTHINEDKPIFRRERGQGTTLRLRMGYDDGLTGITDPVVRVFGRTAVLNPDGSVESADAWQLLKTKAGDESSTLENAASDAEDGTLKYTTPHPTNAAWDCECCNEFLVAVTTALAGGTTSTDNSIIQAKFL